MYLDIHIHTKNFITKKLKTKEKDNKSTEKKITKDHTQINGLEIKKKMFNTQNETTINI